LTATEATKLHFVHSGRRDESRIDLQRAKHNVLGIEHMDASRCEHQHPNDDHADDQDRNQRQ
jgi:hypothetical protein